jgi:integrase
VATVTTKTVTTKLRDGVVKRGETWSYVVRVFDHQAGRTKPKWVGGFPTEAAAKAARDEARVAARRGDYVDRSGVTVRGYLAEWLEAHAVEVKPKTLAGYRHDVERYVVPRLGGIPLQSLRPATLSRFYRELLADGGRNGGPLSARSVDRVHRTLRKALNDAVHVERLLASNPAVRAKRPAARRLEPGEVWTTGQLRTFLEVAAEHRLGTFYRAAAYTGARRGELLALRWSALDLDAAEVTFARSAAVVAGQRVEGSTKGDRSRTISLDAGTVEALREHRKRQAAERLMAGPMWTGDGSLVFVTEFGHPLYPDTPSNLMGKLVRKATCRTRACTTCGTCTRPRCCWPACRCTWWRPGRATRTPASPSRSTRTCSASRRPAWPMCSRKCSTPPHDPQLLLANR